MTAAHECRLVGNHSKKAGKINKNKSKYVVDTVIAYAQKYLPQYHIHSIARQGVNFQVEGSYESESDARNLNRQDLCLKPCICQ